MRRRKTNGWIAGLAAIAVLAGACGGGSSGGANSGGAASTDGEQGVDTTSTSTSEPTTTTENEPVTTTAPDVDLDALVSSGRPVDGSVAGPDWATLVAFFDGYVAERDIGAAVLAVAVDGEPQVTVALGWSDLARTEQLTTDARFRLASVTKPFTKALAMQMAADGLIDLDAQAFCTPERRDDCVIDVVDDAALSGRPVREEMADITVRDLLDHTAGFDSQVTLDPMFAPLLVSADLGVDGLPLERETATWIAGEPLVHEPGAVYAYSNVGYLSAGLALEEAGGAPYLDLLRTHLGVGNDVIIGSSLPAGRAADEVEYACDEGATINLFDTAGPDTCWADGGFHLEAMTAHGALVASADDVLSFLDAHCIDGFDNTRTCDGWHDGSLPGTYTVARNMGRVDYVVLFNQRTSEGRNDVGYPDVVAELDRAVEAVIGDPFSN